MKECLWCKRCLKEKQYETETDYIKERQFGIIPQSVSGIPFWYHRVQLWGVNTETIKPCDNQLSL